MMVPTVHLNGTSKDELLAQYSEAAYAVQRAIDVVKESAPHGRDYYVQTPGAIHAAIAEHSLRIAKLTDVHAELLDLYNAVVAEGGGR